MKTNFVKHISTALTFTLLSHSAYSQGTFVYDQQSADETAGGGVSVAIASNQPLGQSFKPTLSSVGFIRLKLGDSAINGLGATVRVDLLTGSISGTVLASTDPVSMPDGFIGFPNFFFSTPRAVTPGATYYLRPVVQLGDVWGITMYNTYNYADGTAFYQGGSLEFSDLWFREGIVVPEPGTWALLLVGCALLAWRRRLIP